MALLKNICSIGSGQNAPQLESEYSANGLTFIKASNLDDIILDDNENNTSKVTKEAVENHNLKLYPKKSIIFAKSGQSCKKNRVYLTKNDFYLVNHLCVLSNFDNNYSPEWLTYYLKAFNIPSLIRDESYPSISLKDIGNIEVPNIGFAAQEKIVNELDALNSSLSEKKKQINYLNELVKSRFIEMFGEDIGGITFDDVIEDKTKYGYKFDSSNYFDNGEIAIVDQGKELICGYKAKESGQEPYKNECIIFGDHTEIFKFIDFDFYLGADGTKILCVKNGFDTRFVYEYLNIQYVKVGGYSRHFKFLKEQTFIKPDISKQKEFREFCNQIDKTKFIVQTQINDLQELLDKKMDEYFG